MNNSEDTKDRLGETDNPPTASLICIVWLLSSLMAMFFSALFATEILGMRLVLSPVELGIIAIGFSIFHPGGWLLLGGLITALIKKKYLWLILSAIGSVLIGVTIPMLEAIGASSF